MNSLAGSSVDGTTTSAYYEGGTPLKLVLTA